MRARRDLDWLLALMADHPQSERALPVRRRFGQLLDALEKVKARYAVCGAVAMGAHGVFRATADIDVLVAAEDVEQVVSALGRSLRVLGREPAEGPPAQIKLRSRRALVQGRGHRSPRAGRRGRGVGA